MWKKSKGLSTFRMHCNQTHTQMHAYGYKFLHKPSHANSKIHTLACAHTRAMAGCFFNSWAAAKWVRVERGGARHCHHGPTPTHCLPVSGAPTHPFSTGVHAALHPAAQQTVFEHRRGVTFWDFFHRKICPS